ncbi:hypothetical protein [Luteimonas sp. A501]
MTLVFEKLPRALRQAAVTVVGGRNRKLRFGEEYRKWLDFLAESQAWSEQRREQWQLDALKRLVQQASKGTEYYAAAIRPQALDGLQSVRDALDALPLLEKSALRGSANSLRNTLVKSVSTSSTSGSTGMPMRIEHDRKSIQRRFAFLADHLRLAGMEMRDPSVRLSGRILCPVGVDQRSPWLYNPAEKQLFLSSYHLDDAHAQRISGKLQSFRPMLIDGYPSGVLQTLRVLDRCQTRLPSLKAVITTAETLLPDMREEMEALAGVPVMDYYAASEGVPFIQQCPHGTYHVRWQSGIFEVATDAGVGFEGDGELIVTSFVQDRTPLIRYRTGDLVAGLRLRKEGGCACGLESPVVDRVVGRVEDLIHTSDGRSLGMFTYRTLKFVEGLVETQVVQHGYDRFEVNCVLENPTQRDEVASRIKESFERALGYPIVLEMNVLQSLPKGANGKVRLVISKVQKKG